MKVFWEIYVNDVSASEKFYCDVLEFKVTRRLEDFLVLECGSAKLHICSNEFVPECIKLDDSSRKIGAGVEFCFEVEDIKAFHKKVEISGYPIFHALAEQDWGKTDFRVLDPDGAYVRITSPRDGENKFKHLEISAE